MAFEDIKKGLEDYNQEMEKRIKHAHWINARYDFVCSNCYDHSERRYDLCMCCGAKMDEVEHE